MCGILPPFSCAVKGKSQHKLEMSNAFSEERPGPDPRASSSVITCSILIFNMVSNNFRLTEITSYVNFLRNNEISSAVTKGRRRIQI